VLRQESLVVPTESFVRFNGVNGWLLEEGYSTCILGGDGVGKTTMMTGTLLGLKSSGGWCALTSTLALDSTARDLYESFSKIREVTPQRVTHLSPVSKRLAWFIDDLNLPEVSHSVDGDPREGVRQVGFHMKKKKTHTNKKAN
jgi:hypothetical protein